MWKRSLGVVPGIGVCLLPKLICPMCWPAYAGVVSALGLGFLISTRYLLPTTASFLGITAAALGFRASRRHGYGPLWLGLIAAALILIGKFYFDIGQTAYLGIGLLIAASVWNSWPQHVVIKPYHRTFVFFSAGRKRRKRTTMTDNKKHKIEIFSAGCNMCQDAITVVRKLAGSEHEMVVRDMHNHEIARRAEQLGIRSIPAVVINGKLAGCCSSCSSGGVDEHVIREALR